MKPAKPTSENPDPPPVLKGVQSDGGKVTATFETADGQSITTQFVARPKGAGKRGPLKGQGAGGRPPNPPGMKKVTWGLAMIAADWSLSDEMRGELSRGEFYARLLHEEQARRSATAKH